MSAQQITVAMVAGMPYPMTKASSIRVGHLVDSLVSEYQDVRVQLFAYSSGEGPPIEHAHVEYHLAGGFVASGEKYYSWPNKLRADVSLIRKMIRQRGSIGVIHCHTIEGLGIALAFKAMTLSKAPICMDVHGPVVEELVHYKMIPSWKPVIRAVGMLERGMLSFVRHAFVSNDGLGDLLRNRAAVERLSVVYDFVDLAAFDPARIDDSRVAVLRAKYRTSGDRLIMYVGMFKDYQGVDYLIRAFAATLQAHPEIRLILVGDGPCRAAYAKLIHELGVTDHVCMPGLVPHSDVINWLEIADIVVSPRIDNEITKAGFVSQMPEYMALGKVIVATRVSGCSNLLRDGAGVLVEPNDDRALAAGLEQALALDPAAASQMASKARANVSRFTWKHGIAIVYRAYRNVLAAATGGR